MTRKKDKVRSKRLDESKVLRDTFTVSSYGCVDADFDDNDNYVLGLQEELRGRF